MSRVTVNLRGFVEAREALGELTVRMADAAARKAVRAAAKPVVAQARANLAGLGLKDSSGLLSRSIGLKVKKYRGRSLPAGFVGSAKSARIAMAGGKTVAIIGARRSFAQIVNRRSSFVRGRKGAVASVIADKGKTYLKPVFSRPANYAHLIEKGVRPHATGKGASIRKGVTRGNRHPGFRARPWLVTAINSKRPECERIMTRTFQDELRNESARARARVNGARYRRAA